MTVNLIMPILEGHGDLDMYLTGTQAFVKAITDLLNTHSVKFAWVYETDGQYKPREVFEVCTENERMLIGLATHSVKVELRKEINNAVQAHFAFLGPHVTELPNNFNPHEPTVKIKVSVKEVKR